MIYLIVTEKQRWGKASSLIEAAKNAKVDHKPVRATVFNASEKLVESLGVNEVSGGCTFKAHEGVSREFLSESVFFGSFSMSLTSTGKLTLVDLPE